MDNTNVVISWSEQAGKGKAYAVADEAGEVLSVFPYRAAAEDYAQQYAEDHPDEAYPYIATLQIELNKESR